MKIKICDVKDVHTARLCGNLKVAMVGLHAIRKLKRKNIKTYRLIATELRKHYPETIPVLVTKIRNSSQLAKILSQIAVDWVQLYAIDEELLESLKKTLGASEQDQPFDLSSHQAQELDALVFELQQLKKETRNRMHSGVKFMIALPVSGLETKFIQYLIKKLRETADYFLLDSSAKGGTGILADNTKVSILLGETEPIDTFIAGGLNPANIEAVIQQQAKNQLFGVDVQSGVSEKDASRGDPKVPKLVLEFISRSSQVSYDVVKENATRYPPSRNQIISWAVTELPSTEQGSRACSIMKNTNIDSVHLDFSDGSIAPDFINLPMPALDVVTRVAPCMNYDIHLFIRDVNHQADIIRRCLDRNILLRTIYFHVLSDDLHLVDRLHAVSSLCDSLGVGFGLAIQSTRFSPESLLKFFRSLFDGRELLQIADLSLITHSKRHTGSEAMTKDKSILSCLISCKKDFSLTASISIDRDITYDKAHALINGAQVNQIILGKDVNDKINLHLADKSDSKISSLIQTHINHYRRLLNSNIHDRSNNYSVA